MPNLLLTTPNWVGSGQVSGLCSLNANGATSSPRTCRRDGTVPPVRKGDQKNPGTRKKWLPDWLQHAAEQD